MLERKVILQISLFNDKGYSELDLDCRKDYKITSDDLKTATVGINVDPINEIINKDATNITTTLLFDKNTKNKKYAFVNIFGTINIYKPKYHYQAYIKKFQRYEELWDVLSTRERLERVCDGKFKTISDKLLIEWEEKEKNKYKKDQNEEYDEEYNEEYNEEYDFKQNIIEKFEMKSREGYEFVFEREPYDFEKYETLNINQTVKYVRQYREKIPLPRNLQYIKEIELISNNIKMEFVYNDMTFGLTNYINFSESIDDFNKKYPVDMKISDEIHAKYNLIQMITSICKNTDNGFPSFRFEEVYIRLHRDMLNKKDIYYNDEKYDCIDLVINEKYDEHVTIG